jgi:hypothetical protein
MTRERYQTRLDEDVAREVDSYVARNDISQSEGMRRLVREGLESVNSDDLADQIEADHNQILNQINEIQPDEPQVTPANDKPSSSDSRSVLLRKQFDSTNSIDTNSIDTRVRITCSHHWWFTNHCSHHCDFHSTTNHVDLIGAYIRIRKYLVDMSDAKNTPDRTDTRLSLDDEDDAVKRQRIKEILKYRSDYIKTRADIEANRKTGELKNVYAMSQLKAVLDSFLLDIRPVILQSQFDDVWFSEPVYELTIQEQKQTDMGMLSQSGRVLPRIEINIEGLVEVVNQEVVFTRQWHKYDEVEPPTDAHGHTMPWEDTPWDRPDPTGEPLGETEVTTIPIDILDTGFKIANDVLLEIGLDVGLSDDANDIAEFDYSDLI